MRERLTARVVLLDPHDRVLLMKGRLPGAEDGAGAWFTIGGGAEPGETVLEAAAREVLEETGFQDVTLGQVVWRREGPLSLAGEMVMFREHYVLARCGGGEPSRDGWDSLERRLIDDIRWWRHEDLKTCPDAVYPPGFASLLAEIVEGLIPEEPKRIDWS